MKKELARAARRRASFTYNYAWIVGSLAASVAAGFTSDPRSEFQHQRRQGLLSTDWWKGMLFDR